MAKRAVFQYRMPRAKMPKLNITISSSQQGPSNMLPPPQRERDAPVAQPSQVPDMWPDDDDDELIMLASQAAEKVEANAEIVLSQAMGSNLNYENFRMEVQSSTQLTKPNSVMDDFMCVDEELFAGILECDIAPKPVAKPTVPIVSEDIFAEPSTSTAVKNNHQQMENAKVAAQNKFLSAKLRDQKKDNENLKDALNKINEKCQTKEGEASTLRYELEMVRQQCDRLRKEKMTETEQLEKTYLEKVTNLEKIVEKQQSELQFKNIEMLNKKSRRSLNDTMPPPAAPPEREPVSRTKTYNLFKLASANPTLASIDTPMPATPTNVQLDFEPDDALTVLSPKDTSLLQHINYLQRICTQIDGIKNNRIDAPVVRRIFTLASEFITLLYSYALELDYGKDRKYDASVEYKQLSQNMSHGSAFNRSAGRLSCLDDKPCVGGEKLVFERRLLAALSVICRGCPCLTTSLLDSAVDQNELDVDMEENTEQVSFVDLLAITLTNIGFLKTSHLHKGLIEASSTLLTSLASNYTPTEKRNTSLLNLFMAIVYCKPDIVALHQLTEFLGIASKECCNQLCRGKSSDIMNYPQGIRRYSANTCPLQVYASLLEVIFQPNVHHKSTPEFFENISILTKITIGLMTFLRNCFKRSVHWLFRRTDCSTETDSICYCYRYIVSAAIVLLHLCMKFWIEDQKCIDVKTMEVIFKMAALFLQDNFKLHYEARVLQLGGVPIKNRLQIIYDFIVFCQTIFRFGNSHLNAIKSLDLRRNILMNEPQRVSPELQQRPNQLENGNGGGGGASFESVLANTFDQFSIRL